MNIGDRIKSRRKEIGIKVADLAETVGVSPQAVYDWEASRIKNIRQDHLIAICKKLHTDAEWLATGHGKRDRHKVSDDVLEVPKLSVKASAGHGVMQPDTDYVVGSMQVPVEWVRKNVTCTSPRNLRTIRAYGDSMFDTFDDGDIILVDVGHRDMDRDGVYIALIKDELFIKRFERRPLEGVIWMKSDNISKHPHPHVIDSNHRENVVILGRAVWVWNGKRL